MHIYGLTSSYETQEMFVDFFNTTEENVDSNGSTGN